MGIWGIFLLIGTVLLGGSAAFFINNPNPNRLKLILSFGGAYIFGISVLHLMPEVFSSGSNTIGLWVIGGFFLQLLLEQLSQGVEHAHIHAHKNAKSSFAVQIMIGLCVHAFLEGMPLGGDEAFHAGHNHAPLNHDFSMSLLWGIIFHKIPAAFALVLVLLGSGFKKVTVWICLIIFALMSPFGALVGVLTDIVSGEHAIVLLAIVLGSFIHIATTILFEVENTGQHSVSLQKMMAIIVGMLLAVLTIF